MMMYRARYLTAAAAMAAAVGVTACNNDKLTELNSNPNSPTSAPASTLFTRAEMRGTLQWMGGYSQRQTSFIVQHMTEDQYSDEDRYARLGSTDTQGSFTGAYTDQLEDLRKVIQQGVAKSDGGTFGPALVLQAWNFSYITNSFGDVPYSDALKGDTTGGAIYPTYDAQKDIYTGLFGKLDSAVTALKTASNSLGSADQIYKGDPAAWTRFANSLHARLALLLINKDPATAKAELAKALAGGTAGVITTNAQNAKLTWPGDGVYNNPWSDFFKTRDDNRMSKTFIDILNAYNDPRVAVYAQPAAATGTYVGEPNGLPTPLATGYNKTASRIGLTLFPTGTAYGSFPGGKGPTFPSFLFTAAEMNFILAEVSERSLVPGFTPADAAGYYNAGITASMNQWGITNAGTITAYLADPNVAYQGGVAGLDQIATQKWIALFTDGGTAWFEWRRTCVPTTVTTRMAGAPGVTTPDPNAAFSNSTIPRRFFYPQSEFVVNSANVTAAVASLGAGGDSFNGRMYIDQAPTAAPTYNAAACNAP